MWRYPLTDISVPEDDVEAVLDCLRSGWLTMGPRTKEFETAFAEHVGAEHAVAVSSGSAALHLAMLAAGLGPGDEVIVPALTFVATAAAVRYTGATPVLCDIKGPHDLNIDPDSVRACLTPRTRAVAAVHFMGYPADVPALRDLCDEHGLRLIEDAAQAVEARVGDRQVGTVGDLGCFSFFSKKQLCVGEGGMVVTADEELAATVRRLRAHGLTSATWERHTGYAEGYDVVQIGFNYRLDEPRAALGLSRLPRLSADIEKRRQNVMRYRANLSGVPGIELAWDDEAVAASSHFAFPVLVSDRASRDQFRSGLRDLGIQTTWYPSLSQLTAYRSAEGSVPRAEEVAARHCALPLWSQMPPGAVDEVSEGVASLVAATVGASPEG
jgi:dTDP-4-amino-4,6-dideoxygalactose transaminase